VSSQKFQPQLLAYIIQCFYQPSQTHREKNSYIKKVFDILVFEKNDNLLNILKNRG